MVLRISFILLFVCVQLSVARAQHDQFLGNFPIYNFTNDDFNSPVQIWSGCQTENGVLLFGNDEKIIRFNGIDWSFIQPTVSDPIHSVKEISNKKVYKLFKSSTGKVFVARNNSLGTISYDKQGNHLFEPFYVNENIKNAWSIDELPNGDILFINQNEIIRYDQNAAEIDFLDIPALMRFGVNQSSAKVKNGLIISSTHIFNDSLTEAEGVGAIHYLNFSDLSITRLFVEDVTKEVGFNFRAALIIDGKEYLVDQYRGLLPIHWENNKYIIKNKSYGVFKDIDY